jgi:peptidoglycan/LPS O-acetylase OafA/YrhL
MDHLGPEVLLGNLVFLQAILVPTWGSNGPLWSLAFEFWFYIWFPTLAHRIHDEAFFGQDWCPTALAA